MKRANSATAIASLYLLVYVMLSQLGAPYPIISTLFLLSPLVICWMAYSILKFGVYKGPSLGKDEWGYQDVPDKTVLDSNL